MSFTQRLRVPSLLLAIAMLGTTSVTAEDHNQQRHGESEPIQIGEVLAGRLMLMNHSTILMSDLAAREGHDSAVRSFANELHKTHAEFNRRLQQHAPQVTAITTLDSAGKPHITGFRGSPPREQAVDHQENLNKDRESETRPASASSSHAEHQSQKSRPMERLLSIERNAAENFLQSSIEVLAQSDGRQFDMGFLGFQMVQHLRMQAELQAMESTANDDLQAVIKEMRAHLDEHIHKAQELSQKLENSHEERKEVPRQ